MKNVLSMNQSDLSLPWLKERKNRSSRTMVYYPPTLLARTLLWSMIALYILFLILNLVSFGGLSWITYTDYNVQFGLWRVCYGAASVSRTCSQWSDGQNIVDSASNTIIFSGKPSFIRAAEGLEIVSLIFYIIAGILIIIGIIDLERAPLESMFEAAAVLLFLTIIFLSASLGVMSNNGRSNHPGAYLDWAWWIGLLGLIVTIIFLVLLIIFIVDMILSDSSSLKNNSNSNYINSYPAQQNWNNFSPVTSGGFAPSLPPPYVSYPSYNPWPPQYPVPQFYPSNQFQNPSLGYGGMNEPQVSPFLAALVRQQLSNASIAQSQQLF